MSGTNAHAVLEEAPVTEKNPETRSGYLIVLSARNAAQLRQQAGRLREYCEKNPRSFCGDVSYTLLLGRKHFNHRLACVVRDLGELHDKLAAWLKHGSSADVYTSTVSQRGKREHAAKERYGNQSIEDCLRAQGKEYVERLATVADLYTRGYQLGFERLLGGSTWSRLSLPTYPFARERFWIDHRPVARPKIGSAPGREAPREIIPDLEVLVDAFLADEMTLDDVAARASQVLRPLEI
jgi:Polyketide synthase modules and related proteins